MTYINSQASVFSHYPPGGAGDVPTRQERSADLWASQDATAMTAQRNGGAGQTDPASQAALYDEVLRELDQCREFLNGDKNRVALYQASLGLATDASRQLPQTASAAGNEHESVDGSSSLPTQAGVEFDKDWQISIRAAEDKLSGAIAADAISTGSEKELWQSLIEGIGAVDKEYLEVYETVVERYTSFYSDFSDFMSGLTAYLNVTTDDKGNQTMQFKPEVIGEIDKLINTYTNTDKGILFPASGSATKVEADKWAAQLGLDPSCVRPSGSGYVVRLDLSPLQAIRKNLNDSGIKPMTTFQYQSWRSGFDAQSGKFQTTLQTLTTKYGNANGLFDNIVKVLSSAITSGVETLKQILASI